MSKYQVSDLKTGAFRKVKDEELFGGIDFDEDLARAHPYTDDGLHLQMQEDSIGYHAVNSFAGGAPVKR